MVSPQHTTNEGPSQPARPNFAFVSDETQHGVRSHAMRQHWRRRQQRLGAEERKQEADSLNDRVILPRPLENPNIAESNDADFNSAESYQLSRTRSGSDNAPDKGKQVVSSKHNPGEHGLGPVPENFPEALGNPVLSQAISGMKSALASCKLDPFDSFPIKLTAQHHQLLHHWLVMYSTMIFDRLETAYFNPIRDVWLPMDLSNAASFNAIMAHSAAHLAHMRGSRNRRTALKYKTEAIRMVAEWMSDPKLCMSDNIIAAVLRLLTYEVWVRLSRPGGSSCPAR
ncbi:hypothetical protein GMORB2_2847 [Geosmithia morbida]|uniref:Uncharacterized protein n=1 Tax=Geosmithia morbida TaxID=1094350 RepID=A0A9P5CYU9_9HYPO|nr:uncharacterized protein GMORB2_2847 [Geosmithia morbida]KAF4120843.1 hypothetical protein GMORB2_2847 [Geosmithia morbida]